MDPFLSPSPTADVGPEHFDKLDAILVTHGHTDHIADVEQIARRTGALIVSIVEIADYYARKDLRTHGMNIGGGRAFDFGHVKLTIAHHSSSGSDGVPLGNPTGIVLTADGKKIYNAGDTGVFLDMKLISELNGPFDVALLPIGDNFTMGIDDAVKATELIEAATFIPQHYNTFPVIEADPGEFERRVSGVKVLKPGQSYEVT